MIKRMVIMLIAIGAIIGGLYWFQIFKAGMIEKVMAGMANPAQTVSTAIAAKTDWQDRIEAVGTFKAANGADLALQVPGIVEEIEFESGDTVKAGQVLLKLSAHDDVAKLASLQATADNFEITLKRDQEQVKFKAVSQATVDTDIANLKNARALVDQQQAIIDQKTLRAPFSGRLGIRSVNVGQYLTAGTTIVTLQELDKLYVDAYLPQQVVSQLMVGQKTDITVDTYPGQTFEGKITAIEPKVDTTSRNVLVRAALDNPDGKLLPGMFARLNIDVGSTKKLVTLPQTALVYNPYGDMVFIVEKDKDNKQVVRQSFVQTGDTRGDNVAISEGVKAGDEVVIDGQIKLRNGTTVKVDNDHVPVSQDAPVVKDQ